MGIDCLAIAMARLSIEFEAQKGTSIHILKGLCREKIDKEPSTCVYAFIYMHNSINYSVVNLLKER